jgi:DNA mismatch endonuclease, patch repair protein
MGFGGRDRFTELIAAAMADVFSKKKRSDVMSRIRSEGNDDTELALIRLFRRHHVTGWRRRWPLAGKPDFVFPADRLAVFVDGCFWHGCKTHSKPPQSNCDYWDKKLRRNRQRDQAVTFILRKRGWRVLRLWEHDLVRRNERRCLHRVMTALARP